MKLHDEKSKQWMQTTLNAFPKLQDCLAIITGEVFVIGAVVLQFYKMQDWIDIARSTGDIDLSIGITPECDSYSQVKAELLKHGYREDSDMKYRLQLPLRSAGSSLIKIDLVAHPSGISDEKYARKLMGVGDEWSFDGIRFGLQVKVTVQERIFLPNPLGFIGLKAHSFYGDPRRVRDLVDIVDVIKGCVRHGIHYDLNPIWESLAVQETRGMTFVRNALKELENPDSLTWDLDLARQEFNQRGYKDKDVDGEINSIVAEFNSAIGIS